MRRCGNCGVELTGEVGSGYVKSHRRWEPPKLGFRHRKVNGKRTLVEVMLAGFWALESGESYCMPSEWDACDKRRRSPLNEEEKL